MALFLGVSASGCARFRPSLGRDPRSSPTNYMTMGTGNYGAGERRARIFERKDGEGGQLRKKGVLRRAVGKGLKECLRNGRH